MTNVIDGRELFNQARKAPSPPIDAEFYFADEHGRPCSPGAAFMWCWAGGPCWFYARDYPAPGGTRRGRKRSRA